MNTTQSLSPLALIAARVNVGDSLSIEGGDFRTVDTVALINNRMAFEFTDGTTANIAPLRIVEVMA